MLGPGALLPCKRRVVPAIHPRSNARQRTPCPIRTMLRGTQCIGIHIQRIGQRNDAPETTFATEVLRSLWQAICLAKKVGQRLGPGSVL